MMTFLGTGNQLQEVKTAQECLYFLRRLKKFGMSAKTYTNFYRCTVESVLTGCSGMAAALLLIARPSRGSWRQRSTSFAEASPLCKASTTRLRKAQKLLQPSRPWIVVEEVTRTSKHGLPDSPTVFLSPGCQASQSATLISVSTLIPWSPQCMLSSLPLCNHHNLMYTSVGTFTIFDM